MEIIIETQRLIIRKFNLSDAAFVIKLLNTPGWIKFIGDRNMKTKQEAESYLTNGPMKSYTEHGFGLYAVQLKNSGATVCMCGLLKREIFEHADLGFAILPEHEGQGFVYEAASALLPHEKEKFNLSRVLAITLPENARSVKLLERLGFVFEKTIKQQDEELMLFIND